jgi:biotin carboxyl carrier protein
MTVRHSYIVTSAGGREYRVGLAAIGGAWSAEVESNGKRWTFAITAGPAEGLATVDDRPLRWHWDAAGRFLLDGAEHALRVETEVEHRLAGSETEIRTAPRVREIRAPMPGLVLAIEIAEGQAVDVTQGLVIIEAMKMENEITAPVAGVVRGIAVATGQAIERGTLLCRIEPPAEAEA